MLDDVPERVSFPAEEEKVLKYWTDIDAFKTSLKQSEGKPEYVFFDGPPFATGNPHYGHILAGTIKDIRTRYAHQTGHHVPRRFGWDCHGLPIEFEIEKMLGIKTKAEVLELGIDVYNEHCRSIVMRCSDVWKKVVPRMGRWIDFENDYKTMDVTFMESVWWVFKQLFDKDLIYRGFKVMPYSMACSTPISNFEKDLNYQDVSDPAVVVNFPLIDEPETCFVAWTTTPWTLPSNIALCVNPKMEYVKVKGKADGKQYWVMEARTVQLYKTPEEYEVLDKCVGEKLRGMKYKPLFEYFNDGSFDGFRVLCDSYVTAESGTGIVHQAPAFGEDDFRVCQEAKVFAKGQELPCPIDVNGAFVAPVVEWAGLNVKDADKGIMKTLKDAGRMHSQSQFFHSYPHCWRSDTPLIYKAVPSWFARVEDMRERLVKANSVTHWVPDQVKTGRFDTWLANARDWNLGRTRYWGTPMPIWTNEDYSEMICIGSVEELFQKSGVRVTDLHRHHVDQIFIPSVKNPGTMLKRIEEVFDCWFESGSMPYGQAHYPFENKERFEKTFPADFIAEGLDQTRGWFYTLTVLSTALFEKPAFKNNIVNGIVKAKDGKKMSKRLKNYPDPMVIADEHGADALRLYLINSPVVRAQDLKFEADGVKAVVRDVILPWFNAYRFFVIQANRVGMETAAPFTPNHDIVTSATNYIDKWFIASLQTLIKALHEEVGEQYKLYTIVPMILRYLDQMTNWYVRLNRDRLKGVEGAADWADSLSTLFYVLLTLCKTMAPLTPFIVEHMFQNLKKLAKEDERVDSVHYLMLPVPNEAAYNPAIEKAVAGMQEVIEAGRTIRDQVKLPLRQPLRRVTVVSKNKELLEDLGNLKSYIVAELNVKELDLQLDDGTFVQSKLQLNFKKCGKLLGRDMPKVKAAVEALSPAEVKAFSDSGAITILGHALTAEHLLEKTEFKGVGGGATAGKMSNDNSCLILLNTDVDAELELEGISRDIVNRIQKMRKDGGLGMGDKLECFYSNTSKGKKGDKLVQALTTLGDEIGAKLGMPAPVEAKAMPPHAVPLAEEECLIQGGKLKCVLTRLSVGFSAAALKELAASAGVAAAELDAFVADVQTMVSTMDYDALLADGASSATLTLNGTALTLEFGKHVFPSSYAASKC